MVERICNTAIVLVAIWAIGGVEYMALAHNLDGKYFGVAIAAIAGLGGYKLKDIIAGVRGK